MTRCCFHLGVALLGMLALPLASAHAQDVGCMFGDSPRRAVVHTHSGQVVELFDSFLRIDGRVLSRCDGLPGVSPQAIAAYEEGFVVGFRSGGVWVWGPSSGFAPLRAIPQAPVRALAWTGHVLYIALAQPGLLRIENGRVAPVRDRRIARARVTALSVDESGALHIGKDPSGHLRISPEGAVSVIDRAAIAGCFARGPEGEVVARMPGPDCEDGIRAGELPSGNISALAVADDRLFVGTFAAGLFMIRGTRIEQRWAEPRLVNAIVPSERGLFVAAADGLFRADIGSSSSSFERVPLAPEHAHVHDVVLAPDGTLWLGTGGGLVGMRNGTVRVLDERSGLPSRITYATAITSDGAVWAGTARGLARVSERGVDVFTTSTGALPHDWVTALLPDGASLLVGTYNAGVVRLEHRASRPAQSLIEETWINPHGLVRIGGRTLAATMGDGVRGLDGTRPLTDAPLPDTDITAIAHYEGHVWIGTRHGLARLAMSSD